MAHAEELFPVLAEPALYEFIDEEPPESIDALRHKPIAATDILMEKVLP